MAKATHIVLTARELAGADFTDQASFLQTRLWARQKEAFGWKARYFRIASAGIPVGTSGQTSLENKPEASMDVLVLLKVLKAGYTLAYVPHGPGFEAFATFKSCLASRTGEGGAGEPGAGLDGDSGRATGPADGPLLAAIGRALKTALKIRLLALRFDLDWELELPLSSSAYPEAGQESVPGLETPEPASKNLSASEDDSSTDLFPDPESLRRNTWLKGLIKATADIQPPDTVLVDLGPGEEGVLARMKPKTRYNARLAAKKGVTIRQGSLEDLETWYGLYEETARRDRIGIHGKDYYRRLLADNPADCMLLMAEHEGDALAGIILLINQTQATYLYGASSNLKRNLMPAYALQWEGMKLALGRGCKSWDLFGIPPSADPGHPMHGLYQFKTGFGGRVVHRLGTWDLVCSPIAYHAFRIYEALRFWILRRLKKQFS